jgi:DNA invertase Pin-like site-specific DNA recombinase
VANIVMNVAEWERDIISGRTSEALAEARESGVRLGRPITVPAAVIKRVRRPGVQATPSLHIAQVLNADGCRPRTAGLGGTRPL